MTGRSASRISLLCSTAIGCLLVAPVATAQTASQIQTIEQQIKVLQTELGRLKADLAARDREVKAAQAQAKAAQDQAKAAQAQAAAASAQAAAAPPLPPAPPPGPPLPRGAFQVGGMTVTLGGFAAAEGVYRSRNQAASIDTNFNTGIPLPNSPNYKIPEYRETAQQSRVSMLVEGRPDDDTKLSSYLETDFLSAGSSSNSNQSNSYTLRLRQFWGEYDNSNTGWHVEGGQGWSLATMYRSGLLPRQENVPLTIDAQYVVGFDWERQAEFRVVKDFDDHKLWAAISVESPQTLFNPNGGPNCLTGAQSTTTTGGNTLDYTQCGGSNVNTIQAYSDNIAPDIIAKVAADPGWGHYELYGLLRFLGGRVTGGTGTVTVPTTGAKSYETTGQGVGAGMILPLVPKLLDFQVSGLIGQGVGRYGTAQLPDATFTPAGKIAPLPGYSIMGGFVGHPAPSVDVYAYGGAEGVGNKYYNGIYKGTAYQAGYGNPQVNLSGCEIALGSCSADTSGVVEGTLGAWWRFIQSRYGTMELGAEYRICQAQHLCRGGRDQGQHAIPVLQRERFPCQLPLPAVPVSKRPEVTAPCSDLQPGWHGSSRIGSYYGMNARTLSSKLSIELGKARGLGKGLSSQATCVGLPPARSCAGFRD